jgi:NADH:ubiquinone reductase (H+-translocating)
MYVMSAPASMTSPSVPNTHGTEREGVMPHGRKRVIIIGGGLGGMYAADKLRKAPVDITVIDKANHQLYQAMMYQVAVGILSPGQVAPSLRSMLRHQPNARVVLGTVTQIRPQTREVVLVRPDGPEECFEYDILIFAPGVRTDYFGHDEYARSVATLKTIDDAVWLRSRILSSLEIAELEDDPEQVACWTTFAIVGAGPTGVEMAGAIAQLTRSVVHRDFRKFDPSKTRIVLIDAAPYVLGPFDPKLRDAALKALRDQGIEVLLDTRVTGISSGAVELQDAEGRTQTLEAKTILWAAGMRATAISDNLAQATGAQTDRYGRILADDHCRIPGHPDIFVIGDAANRGDLPMVAQPAMQEGKHVGKTVLAELGMAKDPGPFKYFNKGTMAQIGRGNAVADAFGKVKLSGFPGSVLWAILHAWYVEGFFAKVEVTARWLYSLVAVNRRERVITVKSAALGDRPAPTTPDARKG